MKKVILPCLLIVLGAVFYAIGTAFFVFPAELFLGGTGGISVILAKVLPASPGVIITIINILLIVVAFIVLGKGMAIKTFIGSLLTTVLITLTEQAFPLTAPPVANPFLSSIIGSAIIAVASSLLFLADSSSGGTDILALIVKKFTPIPIGKALLLTDFLIVVVGGILSSWQLALASLLGLLIKTLGIDLVIAIIRRRIVRKAH